MEQWFPLCVLSLKCRCGPEKSIALQQRKHLVSISRKLRMEEQGAWTATVSDPIFHIFSLLLEQLLP